MGYSTTQINIDTAKAIVKNNDYTVIEASNLDYFNTWMWKRNIVSAEITDHSPARIIFRLKNSDFVQMEEY